MNFQEALSLVKKTKPATGLPKYEKGLFFIDEKRGEMYYADALSILSNIGKASKLSTIYTNNSAAQAGQEEVVQQSPQPAQEATKKQQQQATQQPQPLQQPRQQATQQLPQQEQPIPLKKQTTFIKEEVIEIKPLLGIDIPDLSDASALAKERAETLLRKPPASSKEELSKKLIELTQQLLREKDASRRSMIKTEMESIRAHLRGTQEEQPSIEESAKKMMEEDVNRAVEQIRAALKVYEGLEDEEKLREETKKAVLTYESYLRTLHEEMIKELSLNIEPPSYDVLQSFLSPKPQQQPAAPQQEQQPSTQQPPQQPVQQPTQQAQQEAAEISPIFENEELSVEEQQEQPSSEQVPAQQPKEEEPSIQQPTQQPNKPSYVDDIEAMREGQLLHELGARDRKAFSAYLRGEISKKDALHKAKVLLAVEKGMKKEEAEEVFS